MKNPSQWGLERPRSSFAAAAALAVVLVVLSALPVVAPETFPFLNPPRIDTDPENMLADDEPSRVFHREKKDEYGLYDQIVVGVIHPDGDDGVFTPGTLANVDALVEHASGLEGVIAPEILSPGTVDDIEQAGVGTVSFDWLMPRVPETREEALAVRDRLLDLPMMKGSMASADGRSLLLYFPIESKDISHRVSTALLDKIGTFPLSETGEEYHITGLPVANDTFGVEMFKQMAISAPLAMVLILLLMFAFFRRWTLVLAPMVVAVVSVLATMGLLVVTGQTIHIMSSMIPIFIMPIAVLDGVHMLSEFHDVYPRFRDRKRAMRHVLGQLWTPMLFTSITTMAGFGSLALAPIPPVQVFGVFVAIGVFLAWFLTILLVPAWVTLFPESRFSGFGRGSGEEGADPGDGFLPFVGRNAVLLRVLVLVGAVVMAGVAAYGISLIRINDNPIRWFEADHRIRVADRLLNDRFAGTYPAYLNLSAGEPDAFKDPELLRYVARLQEAIAANPNVGDTRSLADLVKTVFRELLGGEEKDFRIPGSKAAVAQTLLTYESSHRPDDVYHLVAPDFSEGVIWFHLQSGDNHDMESVVAAVDRFLAANPPPRELETDWFGLTYINVIWQDKMVAGMLKSLLSSFAVVLVLMMVLFRSALWGLLSMVPLSVTIAFLYGVIGLIGKDYDMPVAVLSSLSLGLAIDYAIHFLARSREIQSRTGSWGAAVGEVFSEPARAIARNIIVVGVGFLPLVFAPLVPYKTVGILISSILLVAGAVTLVLLPALVTVLRKRLFPVEPNTLETKE